MYKTTKDKRIRGLNTTISVGILKITPIISKIETNTNIKNVILILLI